MSTADIPQSDKTSPNQRFVLGEEEMADVSLPTFHLFDWHGPLCRRRGSGLSYHDAIGTNTMAETVTIARPPVAKPVSRPRSRKPATFSASALALHLDCSRTYIGKLEAEGVIQRQGDGFRLDQSRVAYLRYLRRERRQSPRGEAEAAHAKAKTELLQIRIMEIH
jgi:hypothetical protein